MRKFIKRFFITLLSIIVLIVIYNIYDNNRVILVEQEVKIEGLPDEFDEFKILQISDLHSKKFGKNQERLVNLINSVDYDIIALTGDMGDYDNTDYSPLMELLDGIVNKQYIFYISGNSGPQAIDEKTGQVTEIGEALIEKGCILLDKPYAITVNNKKIWISDLLRKGDFEKYYPDISEDELKIAITHYPMNRTYYDNSGKYLENYSLIIAGHYHGGQWRIPFYGAFFVPEVNTGDGVMPEQDEVCGLKQYGDFQQYISRGLGASSSHKLLRFRLFNTPEINLITLVNK